jgi:hypothetical protein
MLQELQKTHKQFRNLEVVVLGFMREVYGKKSVRQKAIKRVFVETLVGLSFVGMAEFEVISARKDHNY